MCSILGDDYGKIEMVYYFQNMSCLFPRGFDETLIKLNHNIKSFI